MNLPSIYLCSTSPRRKELLKQIGVEFEVIPISIDESYLNNESPQEHVKRIALQKAIAGSQHHAKKDQRILLAADTLVLFNQQLLGKPKDKQDFLTALKMLSGKTHSVLTAVAVMTESLQETILVETKVKFRDILDEEMEYYWEHYHPSDKAGSYGIQEFAAVFVEDIQGSYSNIVGLPLTETYLLLQKINR